MTAMNAEFPVGALWSTHRESLSLDFGSKNGSSIL